MKVCRICEESKPLEEFTKRSSSRDGRGSYCRPCDRARKRDNNKKIKSQDPDAWRERRRKYVKTYKERHPERVARQEANYKLKQKFGISLNQYERMLKEQNGRCYLCKLKPNGKRLAVDHDRGCCPGEKSCGKCIRKLLCIGCNTALGLLRENLDTIRRIERYVSGE